MELGLFGTLGDLHTGITVALSGKCTKAKSSRSTWLASTSWDLWTTFAKKINSSTTFVLLSQKKDKAASLEEKTFFLVKSLKSARNCPLFKIYRSVINLFDGDPWKNNPKWFVALTNWIHFSALSVLQHRHLCINIEPARPTVWVLDANAFALTR